MISKTYEKIFDGLYYFLFMASGLAQSKFQMHPPKNP